MIEKCTDEEKLEYMAYEGEKDFFDNLEKGIKDLNEYKYENDPEKTVLVCGGMMGFDKGLSHFLNAWDRKQGYLFLLSEVTAQYRRYTHERIKFPHICTPHLLAKEIILFNMNISITDAMLKLYKKNKYIIEAVDGLETMYGSLGDGYAIAWCYYADIYIKLLLKKINPKQVVLWNAFYPFHHIFKNICKEMNIPVSYIEFGCIPGTICIENEGQQGESITARHYIRERVKRTSSNEKAEAINIIEFLRKSGLNRNKQPKADFDFQIMKYYKPGRKSIVYMGQYDYESGMYPNTTAAKKYHSPIFISTLEGLKYIQILAIKNNWNLIYKAHPIMTKLYKRREHVNKVSVEDVEIDSVEHVNINSLIDSMDMVITILSQSAYIALIRAKPVLMLGYSQLRGKGCVYQAKVKKHIERKIKTALHKGYTAQQRNNFYCHVAQLLKNNLYDDGVERVLRYGKSVDSINALHERNKDNDKSNNSNENIKKTFYF
ncbi:MAG: hypothetical protein ACK5LL_16365 [Suipraeoptans sp.]